VDGDEPIALAGDTALFTRGDGEEVDVMAAPVGGPSGATATMHVRRRRSSWGRSQVR
jgi:hypothetical protein